MMTVKPLEGEPGRYHVRSESLECNRKPACRYRWTPLRKVPRASGESCPRCRIGRLAHPEYLVDIAPFDANGSCGCDNFEKSLGKQLRAMTRPQRMVQRLRCKHIVAARDWELDRLILDREASRWRGHERQRTEENE